MNGLEMHYKIFEANSIEDLEREVDTFMRIKDKTKFCNVSIGSILKDDGKYYQPVSYGFVVKVRQ